MRGRFWAAGVDLSALPRGFQTRIEGFGGNANVSFEESYKCFRGLLCLMFSIVENLYLGSLVLQRHWKTDHLNGTAGKSGA